MVERMIRDHRLAFVPILAKITGSETTAKKTVRVLGRQVVRLCLNKPPKATYFQYGCYSGKVDAEKLAALQDSWLKWASEQLKDPSLYQTHTTKKSATRLGFEDEVIDWENAKLPPTENKHWQAWQT